MIVNFHKILLRLFISLPSLVFANITPIIFHIDIIFYSLGIFLSSIFFSLACTIMMISVLLPDRFTGLKMARFKLCEGAESIGGVREAGYWTVV